MNDSELDQLLKSADGAVVSPEPGDLMGGAVRRQTRQQRRRAAAGAITVAVVIAAVCRVGLHSTPPPTIAPPLAIAQPPKVDPEIEIALANQTVDALLSSEKVRTVEARERRLRAAAIDFDGERETTALLLLKSASFVAARDQQAAVYRQVAGSFPDTGAAAVATEQLTLAR